MEWVGTKIKEYSVDTPKNFTEDWKDGRVLLALVDSLDQGCLVTRKDLDDVEGDILDLAISHAEDNFDAPLILDSENLVGERESERHLTEFVSYLRRFERIRNMVGEMHILGNSGLGSFRSLCTHRTHR